MQTTKAQTRLRLLIFAVVKLATCKMGLVATKPVFGVSDKTRLKLVPLATETSKKIEISLVARAGLRLCCSQNPEDRFSHAEDKRS